MPRLALAVLVFLLLASGFAGGVWWFAYSSALDQLVDRGRADLSLASDRLVGQLQQYRELAVLMADHPTLSGVLLGEDPAKAAELLLLRTADKTGTLSIHLIRADGRVAASSVQGGAAPTDLSAHPGFRRAMQGALGAHHARTDEAGGRRFTYAAPVFADGPRPLGAVSVDVNIRSLESGWAGDPEAMYFTDALGVVFISNRSELLFSAPDPAALSAESLAGFGYRPDMIAPLPQAGRLQRSGHDIWLLDAGPYLPARALHLTQDLPVIGMTGALLLDVAPAERIASLQAAVAAALALVFGSTLFLLSQRRRALADRLALEAEAKSALESRVAARTAELSEANRRLRREVAERKEAEAALKRAQEELVQAGKLSALGKMSAGLSHELNQPLMAIRSFSENATLFLERGAPEKAAQNLTRISDLSRRMGRIIKNLRAFARQEIEPIADVDVVAVVDAVLEMSDRRIHEAGVTVIWPRPALPVLVRGGEVRLQQVLLNLVTNALDAMAGGTVRRLEIGLARDGGQVRLSVRDTGPGIAEPEKIFDPFYSTKEVGQSEGMGLGLSISYGLVQGFGGAIRGRNHAEGGAVFTVELAAAAQEEAA
ncbi:MULTISPECIES: ATP-binding protein [Actibacterium]|uniref:C4-dicarboxylate transport sensor protein DctB n=1 Tax=Actibacterium naphthalenivorans TaxID=1614693 RepID=A0A840CDB3_9RHOB|nr:MULTISPECIES: ATP-binding protein [Actibacterium]ALG90632.1 C4-dicarboxylate ABC transporter [Actibacterium sp. EMB200-NS6]MBB4023190.1 two-component system C4-dicarboxylate transport sensor histidine kinase DctB [Actibacterium naphthalenivorans]